MVEFIPIPTHGLFQDLTGLECGLLKVIGYAGASKKTEKGYWHEWWCKCACGNLHKVSGFHLRTQTIKSCGCRAGSFKHGKTRTSEFRVWSSMKNRCYNDKADSYERYGGRGIKVCERWLESFEMFVADMGPRPSPRHSIDRFPNTNGDYEPGNCRWALPVQQARNRTNNAIICHNGESLPMSEWAERAGLRRDTLARRLRDGWTIADAISTPVLNKGERKK